MGLIFILKMPKKVVKKGKVVAAGGAGGSGGSSLFAKSPRNFRIGGDIQPKRNLTRFVKWPKYVRIQRKKAIMMQRLKAPPVLAQFKNTIDKNQASQLLKLLAKYSPETKKEKKDRLQSEAEAKRANAGPKPIHLKFGLNHITTLCEEGKAKLGKLCHTKTATCVALTEVKKEDMKDFDTLKTTFNAQFNENADLKRKWGGGIMGIKNQHMMAKREKLREIELAKKANM